MTHTHTHIDVDIDIPIGIRISIDIHTQAYNSRSLPPPPPMGTNRAMCRHSGRRSAGRRGQTLRPAAPSATHAVQLRPAPSQRLPAPHLGEIGLLGLIPGHGHAIRVHVAGGAIARRPRCHGLYLVHTQFYAKEGNWPALCCAYGVRETFYNIILGMLSAAPTVFVTHSIT
jgi:hypothetical protein